MDSFAKFFFSNANCDVPLDKWAMSTQDPATPVMEAMIEFHEFLMFWIIFIGVFVFYLLTYLLIVYSEKNNKEPLLFSHHSWLEIGWTLFPAGILMILAIPSFSLLYSLDEVATPKLTVKVVGHQWYWSYQLQENVLVAESQTVPGETVALYSQVPYTLNFDSYMLTDDNVPTNGVDYLEYTPNNFDQPITEVLNNTFYLIAPEHCHDFNVNPNPAYTSPLFGNALDMQLKNDFSYDSEAWVKHFTLPLFESGVSNCMVRDVVEFCDRLENPKETPWYKPAASPVHSFFKGALYRSTPVFGSLDVYENNLNDLRSLIGDLVRNGAIYIWFNDEYFQKKITNWKDWSINSPVFHSYYTGVIRKWLSAISHDANFLQYKIVPQNFPNTIYPKEAPGIPLDLVTPNTVPVVFPFFYFDKPSFAWFRLLDCDNRLVLPIGVHIRFLITSSDVLHSWAVPSFGIKLDACPGRLSQTSAFIKRTGLFFGQCSELCGINHAFMPIAIKAVTYQEYLKWFTSVALVASHSFSETRYVSVNN